MIDFGLATTSPDTGTTGTLGYVAPEVLGGAPASFASDIFSLGAVLHEAIFGYLPPHELGSSASGRLPPLAGAPVLRELLADLLHPLPERRPVPEAILSTLESAAGRALGYSRDDLGGAFLPRPPLVGRESALEQIVTSLGQLKARRNVALHVAGAGKSTVAEEAVRLAKAAGIQTVSSSEPAALLPDSRASGDAVVEAEQVATRVVDGWMERLATGPLLINLDGCRPTDPVAGQIVAQLLRAMASDQTPGCALLWTGELPERDRTEGSWTRLELPPLDACQVASVVRGMLYLVDPLPWEDRVHALTGGDPRLVVEVVRAQIEAGLPEVLLVPSDRAQLSERRLDSLGTEERQLLGAIAHAPRPVPHRILSAVVPECLAALPALIDKSLVAVTPRGLVAASPLVAGPARSQLSAVAPVELHQRYADAWRREATPDRLAVGHHLLHAGHVEQGTAALLEAPAVTVEALESAAERLAPERPAWLTVHRLLARGARARGDLKRALAIADEVRQHWPEDGQLLRAQLLLDVGRASEALEALGGCKTALPPRRLLAARACFLLGDYAAASAEAAAGLSSAELSPVLESQLRHLAGLSEVYAGRLQRGFDLLQTAEELAQRCGDEEALARVLNSCGIALQRLGRLDEAARTYERCLGGARRLGDLRLVASCTLNLGTLAQRGRDFAAALAHYRRARSLAERGGAGVTCAWALANEGNLLLHLNDADGARQLLLLAQQRAREAGASAVLAHANLFLAELELSLRRVDDATLRLSAARACLGPGDSPESEAADLVACALQASMFRQVGHTRRSTSAPS